MPKLLSEITPGERVKIRELMDSPYKARLIEMGCYPGEEVELSKIAPLGCPMAVYVSGYELSLRKKEAESVWVEALN